jgi:hypothetical protein
MRATSQVYGVGEVCSGRSISRIGGFEQFATTAPFPGSHDQEELSDVTVEHTNPPSSPKSGPSDAEAHGGGSSFDLSIRVSPGKLALFLGLAAAFFTLLSFAGRFLRPIVGDVVSLFGVGNDLSVPSWYSSIVLLFAAVLVAVIALAKIRHRGDYAFRWGVLSVVFLYLSSDEMLRLHESMSGALLQPALAALGYEPSGIFRYPWILVYAPLTLVFVLAYFKFWLDLPSKIRILFFVAGALFVGGAVGAEMVNGLLHDSYGQGGVLYAAMTHLEEFLEMLGIVIFVYALLSYIGSHLNVKEMRISVRDGKTG